MAILHTARVLRADGADWVAVKAAVKDGQCIVPEPGQGSGPAGETGGQAGAGQSRALMTQLQAEVAQYRGRLDEVVNERDRLLTQLDDERDARLDAEKRAAAAEATADLLSSQAQERRRWRWPWQRED